MENISIRSSPSFETGEDDTPRNSGELFDRFVRWIPPASPGTAQKTRSRAARMIPRNDSLRESKVCLNTSRLCAGII